MNNLSTHELRVPSKLVTIEAMLDILGASSLQEGERTLSPAEWRSLIVVPFPLIALQ